MILQSEHNSIVLIECSIDTTNNTLSAQLTYAESGLTSPINVRSIEGDSFDILLDDEILSLGTYAVDVVERVFELA